MGMLAEGKVAVQQAKMRRRLAHGEDQRRLIGVRQQHLLRANLWAGAGQHGAARDDLFDDALTVAQRRESHLVAGSNPRRGLGGWLFGGMGDRWLTREIAAGALLAAPDAICAADHAARRATTRRPR